MEFHHCSPLAYVVFISILPFIYTQDAPEDYVDAHNVVRTEVGNIRKCGPCSDKDKDKDKGKGGCPNKGKDDIEPDDGNVTSQPEDYVKGHNAERERLGLEPVVWNTTLAEFAQNYADERKGKDDCKLVHSDCMGGKFGENCAWGGVAQDAINMWLGEKENWDPATKTCAPGKCCGHYTQIINPDKTQIGCGRGKCTTQKFAYFVTCNYYAPPKDKKEAEKVPSCGD